MAVNLKGAPVTYGTKTGGGVIALVATRAGGKVFEGSMYASEIRISYDSDSNSAVDSNGETVSYATYNKRRTLSLSGIVINTSGGTPDGATDNVANADLTFATPIMPGDDLHVGMGSGTEWAEVQADDTSFFDSSASGTQYTGGFGNYTITSFEKVRSNTNYAEWSITAIEHVTADVTTSDTTSN